MRVVYPIGTLSDSYVEGNLVKVKETRLRSIMHVAEAFARHTPSFVYFVLWVNTTKGVDRIEIKPHESLTNACYVLSYRKIHRQGVMSDHENMVDSRVMNVLFHSINGKYPVDCFLVPDTYYGLGCTMATEETVMHYRIPVFARLTLGVNETAYSTKDFYTVADYASGYYTDKLYSTAPHLEKFLLRPLREVVSFAAAKEYAWKFKYIPHGVTIPDKEVSVVGRPKVVGSFGRLTEAVKKYQDVFKIYDNAYRLGYIDKVLVTIASEAPEVEELKKPYVDVRIRGSNYVEEAAGVRCAIYNYPNIAFPMSLIEMMARGVVPIVRGDKEWSTMLFPKDYPFMFTTPEEALLHIKSLMLDDALYEKWAKWGIDWVAENFDARKTKMSLYNSMKEIVEDVRKKKSLGVFDTQDIDVILKKSKLAVQIKDMLSEMGDVVRWSYLLSKINERKIPIIFRGRPLISLRGLYRLITLLGYEDTLDSADIKFRRITNE